MSIYSEATKHLDDDREQVELTSDNGVGNNRDKKIENCNGHKRLGEITDDGIRAVEFSTQE